MTPPTVDVSQTGMHSSSTGRWWLQFGGVLYNCSVVMNSVALGRHIGQFEPFEFDVTELLAPPGQSNSLTVTTLPFAGGNVTRFEQQIYHNPNNTYTGQPSCWLNVNSPAWLGRTLYGWDFVPAVYTQGIWREVSLHATRTAAAAVGGATTAATTVRAAALSVIPRLQPPYTIANLQLSLELQIVGGGGASELPSVVVNWAIAPPASSTALGAKLSTQHTLHAGGGGDGVQTLVVTTNLTLPRPDLWHPNGYGAQPLYRASAVVLPPTRSTEMDSTVVKFGVRELTVGTNPHIAAGWSYTQYGPEHTETVPWGWGSWRATVSPPIPANVTAWQVLINGRKVFLRGGNWIPRDQLFGRGVREKDRTTAILLAAKHAGYTFMRVRSSPCRADPPLFSLMKIHFSWLCNDRFGEEA